MNLLWVIEHQFWRGFMNKLFLLILVLASGVEASTQFCGNLGTVRQAYNGDYYTSSIVLYNGSVANIASTPYNDKYLNVVNADNTVAEGYDTIDLLERLFEKEIGMDLSEYAYDQVKLRGLNFEVCLFDYVLNTRNNNAGGRVEARANAAVSLKASIGGKLLYDGSIEDALTYLRGVERKQRLEAKIKELTLEVSDLDDELEALPVSVKNQF